MREIQLFNKAQCISIIGKPMMVETVNSFSANLKSSCKSSNFRLSFKESNLYAMLCQFIGRGKPCETSAYDDYFCCLFVRHNGMVSERLICTGLSMK